VFIIHNTVARRKESVVLHIMRLALLFNVLQKYFMVVLTAFVIDFIDVYTTSLWTALSIVVLFTTSTLNDYFIAFIDSQIKSGLMVKDVADHFSFIFADVLQKLLVIAIIKVTATTFDDTTMTAAFVLAIVYLVCAAVAAPLRWLSTSNWFVAFLIYIKDVLDAGVKITIWSNFGGGSTCQLKDSHCWLFTVFKWLDFSFIIIYLLLSLLVDIIVVRHMSIHLSLSKSATNIAASIGRVASRIGNAMGGSLRGATETEASVTGSERLPPHFHPETV
jgi:hypothetical protein